MSQKRIFQTLAVLGLLVGLWVLPAAAQTGQVIPPPKFIAFDSNGDPCAGCLLYSYAAGTTTPQNTYTTSALSVANANPVVLDSAGRATVFVSPLLSYKFTLRTSAGVEIWTVDSVVGPFASVVSVTAANTRGVQISRTSADAGLSIQSSGGSGKTYGIVSNTSGALVLRDDADGTPNITISGNDVTTTATGTVATAGNQTVSGTLAVTGATTLTSTTALNGIVTVGAADTRGLRVVRSGAEAGIIIESTGGSGKQYSILSNTSGLMQMADNTDGTPNLGLSGNTVRFEATAGVVNTNYYNSATLQPGFLAYNSATDNTVLTGGTVDFDTEVYDDGSNFSADTFTAPVTGRYELCSTVYYSDNSAATYGLRIVTTARTYQLDWSGATSAGVSAGCVFADMTAAHTATVQVLTGDADIDIEGGASPLVTFFSGRLVP